jgi:hypothetical protein
MKIPILTIASNPNETNKPIAKTLAWLTTSDSYGVIFNYQNL